MHHSRRWEGETPLNRLLKHRMALAATPAEEDLSPGSVLWIEGDEAHHAVRVKRLEAGHEVELIDGLGLVVRGSVSEVTKLAKGRDGGGWTLGVQIEQVERVEPLVPRVEVCAAVPKGERFETMASMISQVGAAKLRALHARRSVSDPRPGKLDRIRRVAVESSKQCGRAWTMEIASAVQFAKAIEPAEGTALVLADASGGVYEPSAASAVRLLVGPEGGWTDTELERAREAGAQVASFGPHVMRIETAAVVATSAVVLAERARASMQNAPQGSTS